MKKKSKAFISIVATLWVYGYLFAFSNQPSAKAQQAENAAQPPALPSPTSSPTPKPSPTPPLKPEDVPEADALLQYANSLGKTGLAVSIGSQGVVIDGTQLQGQAILRPSLVLGRAAELYAEAAEARSNQKLLDKALSIWKKIDDPFSPVCFLRHYAQVNKTTNPALSTYCWVQVAMCYEAQGDRANAKLLLEPYLNESSSNEMAALAKATYASYLLADGEVDAAQKIAQDVFEKTPRSDFSYRKDDAYNTALMVLASVPSLSKAGNVTSSSAEAKALQEVEGNPRRYSQLAEIAYRAGNFPKAIDYWNEFRKRFPNEQQSRIDALKAGGAYEKLNQLDKAIEHYKGVLAQYPEDKEGWQASARAAELMDQTHKEKEAFDLLNQAFNRVSSAQGKAWILATQARLFAKNKMLDEAAEKYIGLLVRYGDQDAAKDAMVQLTKLIPQVKRWKYFTQAIQSWLGGTYGKPAQVGNAKMTLRDASQLRRVALAFYADNNDINGGINWLKSLGMRTDEKERSWYVRDEAWFDARAAQNVASKKGKFTQQDFLNTMRLGLSAWSIAPDTEEGLMGLKTVQALASRSNTDKANIRLFIKKLETIRGGDSDALIVEMLIPLYGIVGDQKSLDAIQAPSK